MWMERLDVEEAEQQFKLARKALEEEDFTTALTHLEKALELHDNPDWHSYAGLRIALERGDYLVAEHLCLASIEHDEGNSAHYLNLGKVYLAAGKKSEALETLREGMARGGNENPGTALPTGKTKSSGLQFPETDPSPQQVPGNYSPPACPSAPRPPVSQSRSIRLGGKAFP
jgi:tetratricopeptide (TPR) repeat protein